MVLNTVIGFDIYSVCRRRHLAQELMGWSPKYSLEAGLLETIDWVRDNLHLFRVDSYAT